MSYIIIYKRIRHGYARIDTDGSLQITVPNYLKHDEHFKNILIQKGEKLLQRYQKRKHIQTHGHDFILLFGELVPKKELPAIKDIDSYLKETLKEYSIPLLDKYSKMIGHHYHNLTIRKTKSKR